LKQSKNNLVIGKSLDELYDKIMCDIDEINSIDINCNKLDPTDLKISENGDTEVLGIPMGSQECIGNYIIGKINVWTSILKLSLRARIEWII